MRRRSPVISIPLKWWDSPMAVLPLAGEMMMAVTTMMALGLVVATMSGCGSLMLMAVRRLERSVSMRHRFQVVSMSLLWLHFRTVILS